MGSLNSSGIYVYDASDQVSPLHTLLNLQSTAISNRIGQVFTDVTSTTRPVSPYPNQLIRETDTGTIRFWNSSTSKWVSIPYRNGTFGIFAPEVTGAQTANVTINRYELTALTYDADFRVTGSCVGTITSTGRARLLLGSDSGTFTDTTQPSASWASDYIQGNGSGTADAGVTVAVASRVISAGTSLTLRVFLSIIAGTFNVADGYGGNMQVGWSEVSTAV